MKNIKIVLFIVFILITNILVFCEEEEKIQYWNHAGNQITPDKDDEVLSKGIHFSEDASFWDQKINNALQSNVLKCLPSEWGDPLKAFKDSNDKLEIWINNEINDWAQSQRFEWAGSVW